MSSPEPAQCTVLPTMRKVSDPQCMQTMWHNNANGSQVLRAMWTTGAIAQRKAPASGLPVHVVPQSELIHFSTMRKWVAVFLLVLLPLQAAWSAMVRYDAYQTTHSTAHLGHHACHQEGDSAHNPTAKAQSGAGLGADCGDCHGGCTVLAPHYVNSALLPAGHAPMMSITSTVASHIQREPERPKWRSIA